MQVLTGLGVLLLLLAVFKLFPILSWTVLAIIGVHLLLAWSRRLEVSEDVLFLEWMVAILATLPHNGFGNTSHVIVFFSILFGGVYWILQNLEEEDQEDEEEEGEVEALHNKKEVVEHQLTEESKMLARLAMKPCKDFVAGLLKTFPPVHLPHDKFNTLDLRNTKPGVQLRKLIAIYHPDKVDKVKNGERHFLLCEMITTQLNLRYSKYK